MTTQVHVTRIGNRNGDIFGHTTDHCDEAGCNGDEQYFGSVERVVAGEPAPGEVVDLQDGASSAPGRVNNYDTGDRLSGTASDELARESAAAEPTGAVPAYRDSAGVWQYVQPSQADTYRSRGEEVITVYID